MAFSWEQKKDDIAKTPSTTATSATARTSNFSWQQTDTTIETPELDASIARIKEPPKEKRRFGKRLTDLFGSLTTGAGETAGNLGLGGVEFILSKREKFQEKAKERGTPSFLEGAPIYKALPTEKEPFITSEDVAEYRKKYKKSAQELHEEYGTYESFAGQTAQTIGGIIPYAVASGLGIPPAGLAIAEAGINADDSYQENIDRGMDEETAKARAYKQFAADFTVTYITNKFGYLGKINGKTGNVTRPVNQSILNKAKSLAGEYIKDVSMEVGQELWQQGLSNMATDKPFTTGMGEVAKLSIIPTLLFSSIGNISMSEISPKYLDKVSDNLPPEIKAQYDSAKTKEEKAQLLDALAVDQPDVLRDAVLPVIQAESISDNVSRISKEFKTEEMMEPSQIEEASKLVEEFEQTPGEFEITEDEEIPMFKTREDMMLTPEQEGIYSEGLIVMEDLKNGTITSNTAMDKILDIQQRLAPTLTDEQTKMFNEEIASFQKTTEDIKEIKSASEKAQKQISDYLQRLKLDVDVQFVNTIITPDLGEAFGAFFDGTVTFSEFITDTTVVHEIGHAIFQNIENIPVFKGITKEELYAEAREKYGEMNRYDLEERIMDDLEIYAKQRETLTGKIKQFIGKIYNTLKAVFDSRSAIQDFYSLVTTGKAQSQTKITGGEIIARFKRGDTLDFSVLEKGKSKKKTIRLKEKSITEIDQKMKDLEAKIKKQLKSETRQQYELRTFIQDMALKSVREMIPSDQRWRYLTRIARMKTLDNFLALYDEMSLEKQILDLQEGIARTESEKRQRIGFLKKMNDLSNVLIRDVKQSLGFTEAIRDMSASQLQSMIDEIKQRVKYLQQNNLTPQLPKKLSFDDYVRIAKDAEELKGFRKSSKSRIKKVWTEIKDGSANTLNTVSGILRSIDPSLNESLRTVEFNQREYLNQEYSPLRQEFEKTMDAIQKKNKTLYSAVEIALFNSDVETAIDIVESLGIDSQPIINMREVLDDIYEKLRIVKVDVGYLKNMFPRTVKQSAKDEIAEKYVDEIRRMRDETRAKYGRDLTDDEKAIIFTKYYRGFDAGNRIMLGAGRFDKERTIPTIDNGEIANYYEGVLQSLDQYVSDAIKLFEEKKFFGKINPDLMTEDADLNKSIGYLAEKLEYEGKIDAQKNRQLQNALQAYFGTVSMNTVETFFINSAYVLGLGRVTSAIPQLSETAMYIALNDASRVEINSFRKWNIKPEDINMELLFDNKELNIKKVSEYLTWHVRASDRFSAMVGLNGIFRALKNDASKLNQDGTFGTKELREKIEWIFGADRVSEVIGNLNATSFDEAGKSLSLEIRRLIYGEIGRYRVMSRMDKSPVFIRHPIWGVFKTYTIKMLEAMRYEGQQEIRNGIREGDKLKVIRGIQKKAFLIMALLIAGLGAREAKDWIKGKDSKDVMDYVLDTLLGMFGLNKYGFDMFAREGVTGIMLDSVTPAPFAIPSQILDSIIGDIRGREGNARSLNYVPIIGDILYNRL